MPYTTVTVSASSGAVVSNPISLNWRSGKGVVWQVTATSSVGTGDFTVQYSLDDVMLTTYSATYPPVGGVTFTSSIGVWAAVSSTPYTTLPTTGSIGFHWSAANIFPDGITGTFLVPPAALRLSSTATSSCTIVLKVLQGDGG